MNTTRRLSPALRTLIAASLLGALTAQGANTDISQVPPSVKNTLPPNLVFTLDDSGSMFWDVMPDRTDLFYLFPPATQPTAYTGFMDRENLPVYGGGPEYRLGTYGLVDAEPTNSDARFFRSAAGNPLFYNPAIRYQPWANADGNGTWPNADRFRPSRNPGKSDAAPVDLTTTLTGYTTAIFTNGTASAEASPTPVTIWPASYFVYKGTGTLQRTGDSNQQHLFDHIKIESGRTSYPGRSTYPARTDCGDTCTYDQELQNFANWFSYHRSRLLAARAGIGRAFSTQRENLRVGFAAINAPFSDVDGVSTRSVVRGVRPFSGTDRSEFFELLYKRPLLPNETPLRRAADDIGQYFSRNDAGSPWRGTPSGNSSEFSCYRNFHILMTDGYWTDSTSAQASAAIHGANVDGTDGPTHQHADRAETFSYTAVHPYKDSFSGTLADVAMHYWKSDLRSDLPNNVPTDPRNPAFWQHLSTHTIGFGVTGVRTKEEIASAFTTNPLNFTWPNPGAFSDPPKLDDLAHAAVNGRGSFFSTANPEQFARELTRMLDSINASISAASASAVSNPNVTSTDRTTYETTYLPGEWSGQLKAFELDQGTGIPTANSPWATPAMEQLDLRTSTSRRIATFSGGGVAFKAGTGGLEGTALSQLQMPAGANNAAAVIEYLRGERSGETTAPATFRPRAHLLGAIIHSEPFLTRPPDRSYADTGYATFRSTYANRNRMLYVGANDGMMHAFNAQTGAEEWAYVPGLLLPGLRNLADPNAPFQATVDGFLTVGDVDLGKTQGSIGTDWRTMLVGGLGRGGKGFFALDVTNPAATSDADVAAKALWEFPASGSTHAANVGYSFSRPVLVKHEVIASNGSVSGAGWVVLVSSGYNNGGSGDGKGYLYVLNARTGEVIRAISTNVGSSTSPSGLGQISTWVDDDSFDNTVRWVYGGDLQGNLWRFDLTKPNPADWSVTLLATLTDSGGTPQPITVAPELARVKAGSNLINVVAVGTGRYLGDSDVPGTPSAGTAATQTQSFYVIQDAIDARTNNYSTVSRSGLVARSLTAVGTDGKRGIGTNPTAVDWSRKSGWYVDLGISGERVNADPFIANTSVTFVSNVPSNDPCKPGGSSHLFQFDLVTGSYPLGRNNLNYVSMPLGNALATRPVLVKLPSGKIVALIRKSDGSTAVQEVETPVSGGTIRRLSWRELNYR